MCIVYRLRVSVLFALTLLIVPIIFLHGKVVEARELKYDFAVPGVLFKTDTMNQSPSPYFWLSSGVALYIGGSVGRTVRGELPMGTYWQEVTALANSRDTENGKKPQNLFRLVTKSSWENFSESIYVKITKTNLTPSPERNAWSGIFLFNRYKNASNVYYAGVRMDGYVVIKKKTKGKYITLAAKPYFENGSAYNKTSNSSLLPQLSWFGIKTVIKTNKPGNTVTIRLYIDKYANEKWQLALETTDTGSYADGGLPILGSGYAGLRSDYMDLLFDDYIISD